MKHSLFLRVFISTFLVLLGIFAGPQISRSQIFVEVDGGVGGVRSWTYTFYVYNPLSDYSNNQRNRYIYRASELLAKGMTPGQISSIAFNLRNATPWPANRLVTISMASTTANALTGSWATAGFTTVYTNTAFNLPVIPLATPQWVTFNFQTPYMWDGVSNIIIDFCTYRPGNSFLFPDWESTTVGPPNTNAWNKQTNYDFVAIDRCATPPTVAYIYSPYNRPVLKFGVLSGIEASFPDDVDPRRILLQGQIYDGVDPRFPKPSLSFRQTAGQSINLTYKIVGPLPSLNVIYEGRKSGNPTMNHVAGTTSLYTYEMTEAAGPSAGVNGTLDLRFTPGGTYRLEATYQIPGYTQQWSKEFSIAFPNDLMVRQIRSPLSIPRKYPRGVEMPVSAQIQNVGLNNVTDALVIASIRHLATNSEVYRDTVVWTGNLATGEMATIDFANYSTMSVATFAVTVCTELLSAVDQQTANDCQPSIGNYLFETKYNEEVGAQAIDVPGNSGTFYSRRPFTPRGRIINGGIQDLSNIPVRLQIYQNPGRIPVYNQVVIVPDVGAEAPLNVSSTTFPPFTPQVAGQYEACLTTEYPGDPVANNNQICQTFTVQPSLAGTYTIGTLKLGDPRNYPTIQDAVDDLYRRGVAGAVEYELTDAAYSVGNGSGPSPALDLTAKIIGVDATNTITFKPSLARSINKGSVVVTLNSGNGVGVLFGQNSTPTNPLTVQFEFPTDPQWANTPGFIRFDGGAQKSLVFELNATTPFRAPFYLGDGSHDIAVKNSIIRNAPSATPSYASSLPSINFVNNTFSYQADVRTGPITYSAGIVSRQKLPMGRDGNNSERLDTVPGSNNAFVNNEISGFGYGIVSMGIGMAIKSNIYQGYYTKGSQISGNMITNVRAAGIFVGYEDGAVISGNRIYNVGIQATGGTNVDAAGIVAGGVNRYNNTNLKIRGNEISGVVGDLWSRGISIEQVRNSFPSITAGGNTYFPNIPEATQITNNAIWGIRRQTSTTNLSAIHLFTQRSTTLTGWNQIITPSLNNNQYFTRNDAVYNNTIVLTNDNVAGTGLVAGVGVQHASGASIKNNAFVMQNGASASTLSHSALFYQGVQMTDGNDPMALICDRNAYENGEATMARFVEINANSDVISQGSAVEFKFLSQWRSWTKRDINSVEGTISSDMVYDGVAPNQRLRVKTNPTPIGSLLNNRGERLSVITTDIDGAARGSAGQPFDIGADEFDGRQYVKDLEAAAVVSPSKYRAATGTLSDAEYVMTQTPISITGLVRNIGGLPQTNTPIRLRVYLETPASNNGALATAQWNGSAVVDRIVNATINSGDEVNVVYDLTWVPQSYQQLAGMGYVVPAHLYGMANNISPRYRIEISVSSDEYTPNNVVNKVVRFFVARSNVRMLATARGASVDLYAGTPTQNQIASRLNIDSVTYTLERIGYANNPAGSVIAYDVLDRDNFEERAIDYSIYRTVFWSSDNNPLTRFERRDLRAYVASGTALSKKNLAIAGQNYPRQHVGMDVINDQAFIQSVLRVNNVPPGNPVPTALTYHNRRLRGDAITRNSVETLFRTGFPGDAEPLPALVRMYSDPTSAGVAQRAYNYVLGDRQTTDSIMGSATASLVSNVVYLGVDWRFYRFTGERTGTERVIRGIFDFFESNGGGMVSAELTNFDAKARGNNVDVMWNTASETNSDHFDVERADVMAGSDAAFTTVGTVASAGVSTTSRDYSFRDMGLASGRYLYRLTTVDKDGSRSVSNEVEVVIGAGGQATIGNVSPQPATSNASVEVTMVDNGIATVEIIDASGARVALMSDVRLNAGAQTIDIPVNTLVSGAYTVVVSANGTTLTTPLVIRR